MTCPTVKLVLTSICNVILSPWQDEQFRRDFELTGSYREGPGGLKVGGGGDLFKYEPRQEKVMSENKM